MAEKMIGKKAFTILKVMNVDEDQRIIKGIATTPRPDRVGDVVEPMGMEIPDQAPLLWMHDHALPVGTVKFGKPTKEGIPFEAKIPVIDNPAGLKARVDEAWSSVKSGLVACVSVGFNALEWSVNELTGGLNFLKTELLELSLVTIPANPDAVITGIKSMDSEIRAALGNKDKTKSVKLPSGVSDKKTTIVKLTPKEADNMKISEQIKSFQSERAAKVAKMKSIMESSEGSTLDEAQATEYDDLQKEVDSIDKHLTRLDGMQKAELVNAKPITATPGVEINTQEKAVEARTGIQVKATPTTEKGIAFARLAKCKALSVMHKMPAHEIAENLYGKEDPRIARVLKAAVPAMTTTNTSALVGSETEIFADFAEFLRPMTILGKFGQGGIPMLRKVPFRVPLIGQSTGATAAWVGEAKGKPVSKFDFTRRTLTPLKISTIAVATMELVEDSSPAADGLIRDEIARAVVERSDIDFIDPDKAASAGVSPASITNGITPVVSVGNDAAAVRCDIKALFAKFIAANNPPTSAVLIMSSLTALSLSLMQNPLGQQEFKNITMNGGVLEGIPVITSEYVPTDTDGSYVVMLNAQDIYYADDGEVTVDISTEASLQMDSAPTNNGDTPTATQVVSLWQDNLIGFRAEKRLNWSRRRDSGVAVLSGVNWSDCEIVS